MGKEPQSAATVRSSGRTSCRKKFSQLFAQSVHREAFSRGEEELPTALAAISHPSSLLVELGSWEKKGYKCNRRFPTSVRSRSESTCV